MREVISAVGGRAAALAARLLRVRWVARAPLWLFRARLGFVFGSRMILLEHIGRKSYARRRVVLEVVARPGADRFVVASGFGERAQWLRNVRADPHVRVQVGARRPRPALARELAADEGRAALAVYARAHPRSWRTLRPVFEATLGARIDEEGTSLPLVELDLGARTGDQPREPAARSAQ